MHNRTWTGLFRYPGKEVFRVGTVSLDVRVPDAEIEEALMSLFDELFSSILPNSFERPDVIKLEPGMVVFVHEDDYQK